MRTWCGPRDDKETKDATCGGGLRHPESSPCMTSRPPCRCTLRRCEVLSAVSSLLTRQRSPTGRRPGLAEAGAFSRGSIA